MDVQLRSPVGGLESCDIRRFNRLAQERVRPDIHPSVDLDKVAAGCYRQVGPGPDFNTAGVLSEWHLPPTLDWLRLSVTIVVALGVALLDGPGALFRRNG